MSVKKRLPFYTLQSKDYVLYTCTCICASFSTPNKTHLHRNGKRSGFVCIKMEISFTSIMSRLVLMVKLLTTHEITQLCVCG